MKPVIYYLAFIKKSQINAITRCTTAKQYSLYYRRQQTNLNHRLQLHGILAGEFTSENCMFDFLINHLTFFDDYFFPPDQLKSEQFSHQIRLLNIYSFYQVNELKKLKTELSDSLNSFFHELDCNNEERKLLAIEALEAFEFLLEIGSLLRTDKYTLAIIAATQELSFYKYIPAWVT